MANVTLKKEEKKSSYMQGAYLSSQEDSKEEDIFEFMQTLEVDEARLTEQKEHLSTLLNQLETKAKEDVEKRKRKVEALNSEVSDLKRKCEKYANWVSTGTTPA